MIKRKNKNWLPKAKQGMAALGRYLQPYQHELTVISILGCLLALVDGSLPFINGKLLDNILHPAYLSIGGVAFMSYAVFLVIWLIFQFLAYTLDWKNSYAAERIAALIYSDYIAHGTSYVLQLPLSFHKETKSGSIGNKIQKTANAFYQLTSALITILPQILTILVATILLSTINVYLLGVLIVGLIIYLLLLKKVVPQTGLLQREMFDHWDKAWSEAHDALNNVTTVKQAATEEHEKKQIYEGFLGKALKVDLALTALWNNLDFYQKLAILGTQFIVFILSIVGIINGTMTVGELVAFNGYTGMFFGPFVILGKKWQNLQNGIVYALETEKILSLKPESYHTEKLVPESAFRAAIEFKNIYFHYDKQSPVLRDVSFKVEPGEVVALIGKSGEGKTTIMDLLAGYYLPQKGKILIGGIDLRQIGLKQLRSHIGTVSQEVVLFNDTIKKNLSYTKLGSSQQELETAARKAHALDFIEKFPKKWNQLVGERGVKLSVGQKQRVAIARAILRNPDILILDEPTSALDAESEHFITQSLQELMKDRTTFIIAHRLSTVRRADKIIVLKDGRIAEMGNHQELINKPNGLYKHLYDLQVSKKEEDGETDLLENEVDAV